jgi:hypothetical protein
MSVQLSLLLLLAITVASVPGIRPQTVFEYPYVSALLILGWVLPQAVAVERLGLAAPFDPTITWVYMMLCLFFLVFGYFLGRNYSGRPTALRPHETIAAFDLNRLNRAATMMVGVGTIAYFLMVRQAQIDDLGSEWTGITTFYAQLVQLLVYGGALAWLIYLMTGNRRSLALAIIAAVVFLPIVLTAVKREATFQLVLIVLGGVFFVKRKVPPRVAIIVGALSGIVLLHQVAAIRSYVKINDSSLIGAITAGEATKEFSILNLKAATEVTSAVTDIAIANSGDQFRPFSSMWNGLAHQYFPAFIFGREAKDALKIERFEDSSLSGRFYSRGATRTGFSDSFTDFWYFGSLLFGIVGFIYGRLYRRALAGDLRFQLFYIVMLADGLMMITESAAKFVTSLPFMLSSLWLPFYYARMKVDAAGQPVQRPGGSRSYA